MESLMVVSCATQERCRGFVQMYLRWLVPVWVVFCVSLWANPVSAAASNKLAIVVGVSDYPASGDLWPLNYADNDAVAIAETFESQGFTVKLLLNAEAKKSAVSKALEEAQTFFNFASDSTPGVVVFYFAGHGFADNGNNYIMPEDGRVEDPAGSGLSLENIITTLAASGARQRMLFIDACRENTSSDRGLSRVYDATSGGPVSQGTAVLYSTKFGSTSVESDDLQHGVYTYFLLRGLNGATGDQKLAFSTVSRYVEENVYRYTSANFPKIQQPFKAGEYSGEFIISETTGSRERQLFQLELEALSNYFERKELAQIRKSVELTENSISNFEKVFNHYESIEMDTIPEIEIFDASAVATLGIRRLTDRHGSSVVPSVAWSKIRLQSTRLESGWSRLREY